MEKCEKCGKEYKLGRKDKMLRNGSETILNMAGPLLDLMAPGVKEAVHKAKHYCNTCFHQEIDPYTTAISEAVKGIRDQKAKEDKKEE